ncbi:MAG: endonuclease III, partial [Planctomycetota bacterium]
SHTMTAEEKIDPVLRELAAEYGTATRPDRDPLEVLVKGILSQNTSDTNSDRAYEELRSAYPTWSEMAEADEESIADAIRSGGLANQKASAIGSVLRWGGGDAEAAVERLRSMDPEEAEKELTSIKGVGIKTARLVLLFGFGWPVFVVDTHVHRVSGRLGLIGPNTTRRRAHHVLDELVPDRRTYEAHINLIRHGRACCTARSPDCPDCCLLEWCPTGAERTSGESGEKA